MSDLLIRGMELPRSCGYREVRIYRDGRVTEVDECGLDEVVGVAEPIPSHGRLGDIDVLIAMLERQINNHEKQAKMADAKGTGYTNDMYICDRNRDIISVLKVVPTIIPGNMESEQ